MPDTTNPAPAPSAPVGGVEEPVPALTAKELHLYDMYDSLGIKWGDDPFAAIAALRRGPVAGGVEETVTLTLSLTREQWRQMGVEINDEEITALDRPPVPVGVEEEGLEAATKAYAWEFRRDKLVNGFDRDSAKAVVTAYLSAARPAVAPPRRPLAALSAEINEINRANGWAVVTPEQWADTYKIPGILALIHSEVSEALEGFRHDDRANFDEELADVLIRVLDCAGGLGIDLDGEVAKKLTKNRARGFKHGGKHV